MQLLTHRNFLTSRPTLLHIKVLLFSDTRITELSAHMSNCAYCTHPLTRPPTIDFLLTAFPNITPLYTLDRSIPRCKHCDIIAAHRRAIDAELPPPTYTNPVTQIEKDIEDAKILIGMGVRRKELEEALPRMKSKWVDAITKRDDRIREAWREYWGIWGLEKGQDGTWKVFLPIDIWDGNPGTVSFGIG